jgi:hypothetical protein
MFLYIVVVVVVIVVKCESRLMDVQVGVTVYIGLIHGSGKPIEVQAREIRCDAWLVMCAEKETRR